jgi:hypothetical protein
MWPANLPVTNVPRCVSGNRKKLELLYLQILDMAADSGPPDRTRVIHHRRDQLFVEQHTVSDVEALLELYTFPSFLTDRRNLWERAFATLGPRASNTVKCGVRRRSFPGSWSWHFDRSCIIACTFMWKASSSCRISSSGMRLPKIFSNRLTHRFSGRNKGRKFHAFAPVEELQGEDLCPKAVSSLGHQHKDLPFIWTACLLVDFARVQSMNLRLFLTRDVYVAFMLRRFLGGTLFSVYWWGDWCHLTRRLKIRTRNRAARMMCALEVLPAKQRLPMQMRCPWLWAWLLTWCNWLRGLSVQVYASSGAHHDVLLPSGGVGHGGSSAGCLFVPPSFTLKGGPVLSGEVVPRSPPQHLLL